MDDSTQRSNEKKSEKKDVILAETSMAGEDSENFESLYEDGVVDPIYHAKTLVLNRALQEQEMGRYQVTHHCTLPASTSDHDFQYMLFLVAGFGWFA